MSTQEALVRDTCTCISWIFLSVYGNFRIFFFPQFQVFYRIRAFLWAPYPVVLCHPPPPDPCLFLWVENLYVCMATRCQQLYISLHGNGGKMVWEILCLKSASVMWGAWIDQITVKYISISPLIPGIIPLTQKAPSFCPSSF